MALAKGGGNPFYSPEEVDDDAFLNHPRAGSTGYMLPQHNSMTSVRYVRISCQQRSNSSSFFWATLADVNTDFRVQVKKFFEKKKEELHFKNCI